MPSAPHPALALKPPGAVPDLIPACAHYAGNEKFIRKVAALRDETKLPFDITCDCEDGAPLGKEREHVRRIASLIGELYRPSERSRGQFGVRIHDITTAHWYDEIDVLVSTLKEKLAYLTFPKIDHPEYLRRKLAHLRACERKAGMRTPIPVHAMIESQQGLQHVDAIAATEGVQAVDFGVMDFVSDHAGAIPVTALKSPAQFDHVLMRRARSEIVAAALRHGKVPVDSVTIEFTKSEQAESDAARARSEFGYLRKYSVHPDQIPRILSGMRPSEEEVATACSVLVAGQDAAWGPIRYQDELHDRASYRYFWQLLQRARAAGANVPSHAELRFFAP
jgi:citrate lyase subunit beta/citryl-CoA lyase